MSARVVLYHRQGCHLCEDARVVLADVRSRTGQAWDEVDIDLDEDLTARYGLTIPVVTVDGVQVAEYRVRADVVIDALGGLAD